MMLGLSLATFTLVHVLISLVGIGTGLMVMDRLLHNRALGLGNTIFLWTTIATSVTGFMFPFKAFGPPHMVGAISLVVLAFAVTALYVGKLAGAWRWIYVVTAVMAAVMISTLEFCDDDALSESLIACPSKGRWRRPTSDPNTASTYGAMTGQ